MVDIYTLYFDGSCWPNPGGVGGFGFQLFKNGTKLSSGNGVIDNEHTSNNIAEYYALCQGLESLLPNVSGYCLLTVYGDSSLVINQMSGAWKARTGLYLPNYNQAKALCKKVRQSGAKISFCWIPRKSNEETDKLSKLHLEKKSANIEAKLTI